MKQTEDLGNGLINMLSNELDVQYGKFEVRMKEHIDEDVIRVPMRVFYISSICLVSLFCFFICASYLVFGVYSFRLERNFVEFNSDVVSMSTTTYISVVASLLSY